MTVVENDETSKKKSNFDYTKLTKARLFVRAMLGYPLDFYGEDFYNCYVGKSDNVMYLTFKKPIKDIQSFNKVFETESGHVQEFDDTPGQERIHTYHRSGTFHEVDPQLS